MGIRRIPATRSARARKSPRVASFAPVSITVPQDVALNAVDLAVQLEQLSFQVSLSSIGGSGADNAHVAAP